MRIHHLKIQLQPFEDLVSGRKTGEVRNCADREFREGDHVELFLIDETGNPANKSIARTITHIQRGYGLPDDICVLSYGAVLVQEAGLVGERQECCTPTHEEKQLLANGDYTPEELWGGNRPTCPKCINTSPPAPVSVAPSDAAQNSKRYEWLRSQNVGHGEISRVLFETISDDCNPPYRSLKYGKDLDAAIDACLDKVKELNQ